MGSAYLKKCESFCQEMARLSYILLQWILHDAMRCDAMRCNQPEGRWSWLLRTEPVDQSQMEEASFGTPWHVGTHGASKGTVFYEKTVKPMVSWSTAWPGVGIIYISEQTATLPLDVHVAQPAGQSAGISWSRAFGGGMRKFPPFRTERCLSRWHFRSHRGRVACLEIAAPSLQVPVNGGRNELYKQVLWRPRRIAASTRCLHQTVYR